MTVDLERELRDMLQRRADEVRAVTPATRRLVRRARRRRAKVASSTAVAVVLGIISLGSGARSLFGSDGPIAPAGGSGGVVIASELPQGFHEISSGRAVGWDWALGGFLANDELCLHLAVLRDDPATSSSSTEASGCRDLKGWDEPVSFPLVTSFPQTEATTPLIMFVAGVVMPDVESVDLRTGSGTEKVPVRHPEWLGDVGGIFYVSSELSPAAGVVANLSSGDLIEVSLEDLYSTEHARGASLTSGAGGVTVEPDVELLVLHDRIKGEELTVVAGIDDDGMRYVTLRSSEGSTGFSTGHGTSPVEDLVVKEQGVQGRSVVFGEASPDVSALRFETADGTTRRLELKTEGGTFPIEYFAFVTSHPGDLLALAEGGAVLQREDVKGP